MTFIYLFIWLAFCLGFFFGVTWAGLHRLNDAAEKFILHQALSSEYDRHLAREV